MSLPFRIVIDNSKDCTTSVSAMIPPTLYIGDFPMTVATYPGMTFDKNVTFAKGSLRFVRLPFKH